MIKSSMNQNGNVKNPNQGNDQKVLCVCSAGLLRSPTMANVINQKLGLNTRACGAAKNFALIPITEALIRWADEIVFVNREAFLYLDQEELALLRELNKEVTILEIPDIYMYNDTGLRDECLTQYLGSFPTKGENL